jgi:hypothetical protein
LGLHPCRAYYAFSLSIASAGVATSRPETTGRRILLRRSRRRRPVCIGNGTVCPSRPADLRQRQTRCIRNPVLDIGTRDRARVAWQTGPKDRVRREPGFGELCYVSRACPQPAAGNVDCARSGGQTLVQAEIEDARHELAWEGRVFLVTGISEGELCVVYGRHM